MKENKGNIYAYAIGETIYLNITNRCTNQCVFCVRQIKDAFGDYNLWLDQEPDLKELLAAVGDVCQYREVVFCGYGEPLLRADLVIEASRILKKQGAPYIRIDTNGQADLFYGPGLARALASSVDAISISLNAPNTEQYVDLCKPQAGEKAYPAIFDFIKDCQKYIPKVIVSIVKLPGIDIDKCRSIAYQLGVVFRIREYSGSLPLPRHS